MIAGLIILTVLAVASVPGHRALTRFLNGLDEDREHPEDYRFRETVPADDYPDDDWAAQ